MKNGFNMFPALLQRAVKEEEEWREGGQCESGCIRCVEPWIQSNIRIRSQEQGGQSSCIISFLRDIFPQAHAFPLQSQGTLSLAFLCWNVSQTPHFIFLKTNLPFPPPVLNFLVQIKTSDLEEIKTFLSTGFHAFLYIICYQIQFTPTFTLHINIGMFHTPVIILKTTAYRRPAELPLPALSQAQWSLFQRTDYGFNALTNSVFLCRNISSTPESM